jgi:hypothetical protein
MLSAFPHADHRERFLDPLQQPGALPALKEQRQCDIFLSIEPWDEVKRLKENP